MGDKKTPRQDDRKMLSVRVSPKLMKAVTQRAVDDDTSNQAVVTAALEEYLAKKR